MRFGCLRCWHRRGVFVAAPMLVDPWGRSYEARCDDCNEALGEAQAERDFAAFHGGLCSQSVYNATYAQMVRGRR